jgi:hypothetical protein
MCKGGSDGVDAAPTSSAGISAEKITEAGKKRA